MSFWLFLWFWRFCTFFFLSFISLYSLWELNTNSEIKKWEINISLHKIGPSNFYYKSWYFRKMPTVLLRFFGRAGIWSLFTHSEYVSLLARSTRRIPLHPHLSGSFIISWKLGIQAHRKVIFCNRCLKELKLLAHFILSIINFMLHH